MKLAFAFLIGNSPSAPAIEQTLPLLKTRTLTYTNVTVTTKTEEYVFILHAGGMANIKIPDLSPEAKRALGYTVPEEKHSQPLIVRARQLLPDFQARIKPFEKQWRAKAPWSPEQIHLSSKVIYGLAAAVVVLYLFGCYCCHLICVKSKSGTSFLVWLPVLKWIPLLRAAEMSAWWLLIFFLLFVPIIWAFKIAKARGMSAWVSVFLILPVTGPLAFLYLAFARADSTQQEAPKYQSMALQTG